MDYLQIIENKCRNEGLEVEVSERESQTLGAEKEIIKRKHRSLRIHIPEERDRRPVLIGESSQLDKIAGAPFEKFRFVKGYKAIWSKELGVIECELEIPNNYELPFYDVHDYFIYNSILEEGITLNYGAATIKQRRHFFHFPSPKNGLTLSLGEPSEEFQILESFQRYSLPHVQRTFTFRIEGLFLETSAEARHHLVKLANSVLFQLDLVTDVAMHLGIYHGLDDIGAKRNPFSKKADYTPPQYEYDQEPIDLYFYARSAVEMPLL